MSTTSSEPHENEVLAKDLPMTFKVKYLGSEYAKGLWGIKHTRRPVDHLVSIARNLPANKVLPLCNLTVSLNGVSIETTASQSIPGKNWHYAIDTISYGVQDLVYTRVFAMIIVKEDYNIKDDHLFEVHAFVCDSRAMARKLTYALASAFHDFCQRVKEAEEKSSADGTAAPRKKFAIDLRTPEEMSQETEDIETEA